MTTIGRWSPNKVRARVLDGTWPEPIGGMELMIPTSVVATGTGSSASINTNGSVTFSTCATLSLNGVFTTDYDNYMITIRHIHSTSGDLYAQLVTAGTASTTGYTWQYLFASSTTVSAARNTASNFYIGASGSSLYSGHAFSVYGPFLSQPTASRSISSNSQNSATIYDLANTHSASTSYDGLKFLPNTGTVSGLVSVYGLVGT